MKKLLIQLMKDKAGLSTMEYAVLFVVIVVAAVGLWSTLGDDLAQRVSDGTGVWQGALDNSKGGQAQGGTP